MNLRVNYFNNNIFLNDSNIQVIEIENKKMFYKFICDLYLIKNGDYTNELYFYDNQNEEINLQSKIEIYINFFDLDLNSKKNLNSLNKKIINNLSDVDKQQIFNIYKKMYKSVANILKNIDLPLILNEDLIIDDIIKLFKVSINDKNDLLDNLLLLIDLESVLKTNEILFLVNLKQLLSKEELEELYKYAIYNNITIILVDSQSYGVKLNYENKLIIDNELEEFVL